MATVRKRGEKWRVEIYRDGIRKSKTCSTKAEAILWGAEEEKKIELQAKGLQPKTLFSDVIKRFDQQGYLNLYRLRISLCHLRQEDLICLKYR